MVTEVKLCIWYSGFAGYPAANIRALARSQDDSTRVFQEPVPLVS